MKGQMNSLDSDNLKAWVRAERTECWMPLFSLSKCGRKVEKKTTEVGPVLREESDRCNYGHYGGHSACSSRLVGETGVHVLCKCRKSTETQDFRMLRRTTFRTKTEPATVNRFVAGTWIQCWVSQ